MGIEVANIHPRLKINRNSLKRLIKNIVNRFNLKVKDISIVLVDDDYMRELNKRYRRIDSPTDVLSFSMEEDFLWGDIYISLDTAERQAQFQGWKLDEEVRFLAVHGLLHLMGYEDETEEGYNEMMSLSSELLK
ncbi:MAG: rRNA maturation RNase YbeY [bacterium]